MGKRNRLPPSAWISRAPLASRARAVCLALSVSVSAVAAAEGPPAARVAPVTDDYAGTKLVDGYRWMESGGDELGRWMRGQGDYTARVLGTLPGRDKLVARVRELSLGTG